jgi:hypothetical protein
MEPKVGEIWMWSMDVDWSVDLLLQQASSKKNVFLCRVLVSNFIYPSDHSVTSYAVGGKSWTNVTNNLTKLLLLGE